MHVDDHTARRLRIAKILLERASDQLDLLEYHPDVGPEPRAKVGEVLWLVFAAIEELPH